jgi:hypothetical protein
VAQIPRQFQHLLLYRTTLIAGLYNMDLRVVQLSFVHRNQGIVGTDFEAHCCTKIHRTIQQVHEIKHTDRGH